MIDVFKIGVSISATNGVSSVLKVMQRDLFGLNQTIDVTKGKFDRLKLAAVGAMSATAGMGILAGIGKMVMAGADVVHQQQLMVAAGMSNKDIALATAQAWQTTSDIMGSSITENLKSIRELRMVFGSDSEAIKYLPMMAQAQQVVGSLLGKDSQDQVFDLAKALEIKGVSMDPAHFQTLLDQMIKAAIASGGRVTGSDYLSAFKFGRSATQGWDDQFVGQILPTLIQEMKSGGGGGGSGGPGNALMSAYAAVVGGTMGNKAAEQFYRLGLLKPGSVVFTRTGSVKGIRPGGVEGSDEFASNPYQWVQDVLVPALKKNHITDPNAIREMVAHMFQNRTAQQIIDLFATQQLRFEKDADQDKQAQGLGAWSGLITHDLVANVNAFSASLTNLVKAIGTPLVPMATRLLHSVTVGIDEFTLWLSKHPGVAKTIGIVTSAVGGFLVVFGGTALIAAMAGALGVLAGPIGLLALAGGIIAIGAAFDKIPKWLIAMAAGGIAGAAAGSAVPIVGTAVGFGAGAVSGLILQQTYFPDSTAPQHVDEAPINPSTPSYQSPLQRLQAAQDAAGALLRQKDLTNIPTAANGNSGPLPVLVVNGKDIAEGTTRHIAKQAQQPSKGPNFGTPSMTPYYPNMMGGLY